MSYQMTVLTNISNIAKHNGSKTIRFQDNLKRIRIWQTTQKIICHQNYYTQIERYSNSIVAGGFGDIS